MKAQNIIDRYGPDIVTAIACIVAIDLYAGATGTADPFPVWNFPLFAALRGLVITISVTYSLRKVRALMRAQKRNNKIIILLAVMNFALLASETAIVSPFILSRMMGIEMAKMLLAYSPEGMRIGAIVLVLWSVVVALVATLSVATAAVATFVSEQTEAQSVNDAKPSAAHATHDAYKCAQCVASFPSQNKLAAHMRWKHPKVKSDGNGHNVTEEKARVTQM